MKTAFIYYNPHPIHKTWADSVTKTQVPFISKRIFNFRHIADKKKSIASRISNTLRTTPALLQPLSLTQSIKIPKADIYLIENPACLPPVIARKPKNAKIIMINDDIFFYLLKEAKGIKKKLLLKYLSYVDGIISSSHMIKNLAQKFTKKPNLVNHAYVNTKKFGKTKANINSNNICFTGMIAKQKRPDIVIQSFLKLQKKLNNKLYLIGAEENKIPLLEKNKKNKNIIVTGWTKTPEQYMKKCGFYINPAEREAFGMNILEAMSLGIPPLVSKECGAAEIVAKVDKRLIIKRNAEDIAKKLLWLHNNPKLKKKLGEACRKEAFNNSKEQSAKNFKKTFVKLVKMIA